MGTGFTIDTPLKVGRYGISSVVSIVDDTLAEQMRKYHAEKEGLPYEPIGEGDDDKRARRFTAYLDLMADILDRQMEELRSAPFEPGSEITRYFELLPDCELRSRYKEMISEGDPEKRRALEDELRTRVVPGGIDVNIMTKLDTERYSGDQKLPPEYSDAMCALRGFARSSLSSSIVFSAGLNPRLYGYINKFEDFLPQGGRAPKKKIILKVSDYRSAQIQGRFLGKHGLWVSEYRIESGINCGGHAFPTTGTLMGPILDEFRENREKLFEAVTKVYTKGLKSLGIEDAPEASPFKVTVQGGIGTHEEEELLLKYYEVDGTGWGTPFMLVPEATNLDAHSLKALADAGEDELSLSQSSPFGIPFWKLKTSLSEAARKIRIKTDKPGVSCIKGFLKYSTEFSEKPVCRASNFYIKKKLEEIFSGAFGKAQAEALRETTLQKLCLCVDLAGSATRTYGIEPEATSCVCAGPNGAYFDRTYTLEEMVDHIYGRISSLVNPERPHMFIKELSIYLDYMREELDRYALKLSERTPKYFEEFHENLLSGIENYHKLASEYLEDRKEKFLSDLETLKAEVEKLLRHEALGATTQ
jgi:hypothetical protein